MYKVYVGCLPAFTTTEQFRHFFSEMGPISKAQISKTKGNKLCSGTGTFTCQSKTLYHQILQTREFDFYGRNIFCEALLSGEELIKKNMELSQRRVHISNLPDYMTDQMIEQLFSKFGRVQNAYRIKSLQREVRPFGFVTFYSQGDAAAAVRGRTIIFNNHYIYITGFKKDKKVHKGKKEGDGSTGTYCPKDPLSKYDSFGLAGNRTEDPGFSGQRILAGTHWPKEKRLSCSSIAHIKPTSKLYHRFHSESLEHQTQTIRFNILLEEPDHLRDQVVISDQTSVLLKSPLNL